MPVRVCYKYARSLPLAKNALHSPTSISQISTLFPSIMGVKVAPFHGMTDLLQLGRQTTCVIQSSKSNVICSIEIGGDTKYKSFEISKMKRWPDKVGELLGSIWGSMYFSAYHYPRQNKFDHLRDTGNERDRMYNCQVSEGRRSTKGQQ